MTSPKIGFGSCEDSVARFDIRTILSSGLVVGSSPSLFISARFAASFNICLHRRFGAEFPLPLLLFGLAGFLCMGRAQQLQWFLRLH